MPATTWWTQEQADEGYAMQTARVEPPFFVLSLGRPKKGVSCTINDKPAACPDPNWIDRLFLTWAFRNEDTANRVAKALKHAMEICGGGQEEDLFSANEIPASKASPDESHTNAYDAQLKNAMALWKNNEVSKAEEAAATLIQADPNRWEGYGLAGAIERAQNKLPEAKASYQQALSVAPEGVKPQITQAIQQIAAEQRKP